MLNCPAQHEVYKYKNTKIALISKKKRLKSLVFRTKLLSSHYKNGPTVPVSFESNSYYTLNI